MASSIYTRTGDKGTTSLVDGSRRPKDDLRIAAYGTVDEANSWIGSARSFVADPLLGKILEFVQHRFYNCSSNLATPPGGLEPPNVTMEDIQFLEDAIDTLESKCGAISGFVLPGGPQSAGLLHVARTVCRRAERVVWSLASEEEVDALVLKFINRSSDLLFAGARYAAHVDGDGDVHWDKTLPPPSLNGLS